MLISIFINEYIVIRNTQIAQISQKQIGVICNHENNMPSGCHYDGETHALGHMLGTFWAYIYIYIYIYLYIND